MLPAPGNKKASARYANKDCHTLTNCRCSAELTVGRASGSEHRKIYVTVTIEGKPCDMEVDTGPAMSIVSWSTIKSSAPCGGEPPTLP
ncbi:Hypothetical predicted protein [Podarcis lilfordi]|uniref:Uncharacterized protein n=1 Tax=Podarcis lilfordi TaxID=74358 RepID=A0AA35PEZ2_9SAUR|nr:Hypothetical predicted protein [Podarcis lilfordi]